MPRHIENSGSSTCPRREYLLISFAMHSVDKRMHASHVHERTEPTGATFRVFGPHTGCSGARRLMTFSLVCMRTCKLQGLCCVVACGILPHSASDIFIHLHQPRSRLPWSAPGPGCTARLQHGSPLRETITYMCNGDHHSNTYRIA